MRRFSSGLVVLLLLLTAACSDDDGGGSPPDGDGNAAAATVDPGAAASLELSDLPSLGEVIVDGEGRTVYLFTKDSGSTSNCADSCAELWPPVLDEGGDEATAGDGLDASKLGRTTRKDGKAQLTYAGHPLYRYAPDAKPGDAKGQGIGAAWYVVSASGEAVTTATGASGTPSY